MKNIIVLLLLLLIYISCKNEVKKTQNYEDEIEVKNPEPIADTKGKITTTAEAIAHANGFKNWKNVSQIKFTFNIDRDTIHSERSWSWKPKEDIVTLTSQKDTITYTRANMDSTTVKVDQGFINDKYWLLTPFNLVWDAESFTSEHQMKATAPISNTEMQKLTIVYKDKGGYTPGDAYDFYFEGDFMIKEWIFRQGNSSEPSLITSWEDYKNYNGIKIAQTYKINKGNWKLYFTGIEVITD